VTELASKPSETTKYHSKLSLKLSFFATNTSLLHVELAHLTALLTAHVTDPNVNIEAMTIEIDNSYYDIKYLIGGENAIIEL
jgi:hypothetical protein